MRDVRAAVAHYRERFGFGAPHETDGFAVLTRDDAGATDFGTREFATLDLDGNLLSFFHWEARVG